MMILIEQYTNGHTREVHKNGEEQSIGVELDDYSVWLFRASAEKQLYFLGIYERNGTLLNSQQKAFLDRNKDNTDTLRTIVTKLPEYDRFEVLGPKPVRASFTSREVAVIGNAVSHHGLLHTYDFYELRDFEVQQIIREHEAFLRFYTQFTKKGGQDNPEIVKNTLAAISRMTQNTELNKEKIITT